ncbi:I78 family peptidase inhibitor [Pseudomonas sp. 2835]|uniref:I78 family peptidase inhibitor n=1 Tax=Pseudomonas sp. 2835 TaxID=3156451 RepID=UPI003D233F63
MTNEEVLHHINHLVGTRYVPSAKAYISEMTGRARVVGAGEFSTREYDPSRIQVIANDEGIIQSFHFS